MRLEGKQQGGAGTVAQGVSASEGGSICLAHVMVAVWAVGPALLVLQLDL